MKKSNTSFNIDIIFNDIIPIIAKFLSSYSRLNLMLVQKKYRILLKTPNQFVSVAKNIIDFFKFFPKHQIKYKFIKNSIITEHKIVVMYILASLNIRYHQSKQIYCKFGCECSKCILIDIMNRNASIRWLSSSLYWDTSLTINAIENIKIKCHHKSVRNPESLM